MSAPPQKTRPRAVQDDGAHALVGADRLERIAQRPDQFGIEGVANRRPVEADGGDPAATAFETQDRFGHGGKGSGSRFGSPA